MTENTLPINQILLGNCIDVLGTLPESSIDLIFADPPYNLQLRQELWRPNMTRVEAVDDAWDRFDGFEAYDAFSEAWLRACQRVLKDNGTMWVIGTYHHIYRTGALMQDLGFWFLNDIVWVKTNPMPNFRGVRFTNAHETLIWACKFQGAKYTFNHHAMKALNDDLQMRSDWRLPICSGSKRIRLNGKKAHSTQKPEALLYRVILASSHPGDVVLDPFFGSGTTGAVAKKLGRQWIGIEKDPEYMEIARARIAAIPDQPLESELLDVRSQRRRQPRMPFAVLLEAGLLFPGQRLFFRGDRELAARVKPNGKLMLGEFEGSIHQAGSYLMGGSPCNGWDNWFYEDERGVLVAINALREKVREI